MKHFDDVAWTRKGPADTSITHRVTRRILRKWPERPGRRDRYSTLVAAEGEQVSLADAEQRGIPEDALEPLRPHEVGRSSSQL